MLSMEPRVMGTLAGADSVGAWAVSVCELKRFGMADVIRLRLWFNKMDDTGRGKTTGLPNFLARLLGRLPGLMISIFDAIIGTIRAFT